MIHLTSLSWETWSKCVDEDIFKMNRLTLLLCQWTTNEQCSILQPRSVGAHHIIMQMHLFGNQRDAWYLLNQFYMERLLHCIGCEKDELLNCRCVASHYKYWPGTQHIKGPYLKATDTLAGSLVSRDCHCLKNYQINSHYKSIYEYIFFILDQIKVCLWFFFLWS